MGKSQENLKLTYGKSEANLWKKKKMFTMK